MLTSLSVFGVMAKAEGASFVIDFEALRNDSAGLTNEGASYSEDGFTLVTSNPNNSNFFSVNAQDTPRYQGSVSFFDNNVNGEATLTKDDGSAFDLLSIDLDQLNTTGGAPVNFTGTKADSSTVNQSFTLDGVGVTDDSTRGFQTFNFTGFDNLLSVSWIQQAPFHHFDNITLSASNSLTTPEPSLVLGIISFGVLGFLGKSKK
ncbi:MAG: PEP-CTERM sorting domain-containing protein [Cyanobacterium sp. T60_A2020_053]|nr:PEP-CTERM sorting domain-containing protein [Cyanobacterium sp. T60_A2020_053]